MTVHRTAKDLSKEEGTGERSRWHLKSWHRQSCIFVQKPWQSIRCSGGGEKADPRAAEADSEKGPGQDGTGQAEPHGGSGSGGEGRWGVRALSRGGAGFRRGRKGNSGAGCGSTPSLGCGGRLWA